MALTTTQVNQAFLATLGRPAEGSAATWGSTSLSLGALSDSIFIAENTEDFVESLYTEILGRASDAEGKAFWNSLLATTSKEAVLAQFKAAVIAAGQADPSNADYQSFIAQNKAFVATLYANLLGRDDAKTADAEGVDFWANALATGMSRGDLISAFVSAALSDPNSDDAQTLNAKLSVADAFSAAFNDFGKDVTADEKKAALDALKTTMTEVVAGSTVEEFQDTINQFKGQNQDRKTDVFTKGEDDLDASESTAATTFRGTINISDSEKSTIESGDTATGNSEYAPANTLIVDVKSDGKEKDFTYSTEMAGVKINNVDNLTINNGTADVTLNLDGNNADFSGKVAITGKGDKADVTVAQDVASLNVSTSGAKKAYTDVTVNSGNTLGAFEGSAAKDTLTISGNIAKSINTGDGADEVTLSGAVFEKATISLGGGDDTLTISTNDIGLKDANGAVIDADKLKASVTIDGGAGTKDKLILQNDISAGVKAITGVEFINSTGGAISSAVADGLKTSVEGILTVKADYTNTKTIDLRGIKAVKDNDKKDLGSLSLSGITYENITLSSNISENIVVDAHTAKSKKSYAEINKFAAGDKISVNGLTPAITVATSKDQDLTNYNDVASLLLGKTGAVAINDLADKKSYIWQIEVDGLIAPKLVAIVDKKLTVDGTSFVYDNGTGQAPVDPGQPTGDLKATPIKGAESDFELKASVSVREDGTTLKLASDNVTTLKAASAIALTVNTNSQKAGTLSFDPAVKNSDKIALVDLQGTGTRTVDLTNVNATAVKNIKDGAANTTLDISNKTFGASASGDQFLNGLKIDLGAGDADVVVLKGGANYASGAFTLTGVEGIKVKTGAATLDAALVTTKDASGAYTSNIDQIGGELKLQTFDAGTTSIDLSKITKADTGSKLTIDVASVTGLTSVTGTAAANSTDTLLLESAASAGKDYSSITAITGIEKISLGTVSDDASGAKISYAAIKDSVKADAAGITLVSDGAGSGSFTITTGAETAIDLSKLANGTAAEAIAGVTLESVAAKSTVTLNAEDKLVETIKLANVTTKTDAITITGVDLKTKGAANDKIDFNAIVNGLVGSASSTNKLEATSSSGMTSAKAYVAVTNTAATDVANLDLNGLKAIITDSNFKFTNGANNKAVVFVSNSQDGKDLTGVYLLSGPASSATSVSTVELIATINGADIVADTYKVVGGVLQFA